MGRTVILPDEESDYIRGRRQPARDSFETDHLPFAIEG